MLERQIVVKGLGKQIDIEDKVHKRCYHKFSFRILDSHICQRYHIQDCIITEVNTKAAAESTIRESMGIVCVYVCACVPLINYAIGQYFLAVNHVILVYYYSSFLSTLSTNACCTLSINIPITYYPANRYYYYYYTSPE